MKRVAKTSEDEHNAHRKRAVSVVARGSMSKSPSSLQLSHQVTHEPINANLADAALLSKTLAVVEQVDVDQTSTGQVSVDTICVGQVNIHKVEQGSLGPQEVDPKDPDLLGQYRARGDSSRSSG